MDKCDDGCMSFLTDDFSEKYKGSLAAKCEYCGMGFGGCAESHHELVVKPCSRKNGGMTTCRGYTR